MYWSRGYQQLKKALIERYNLLHELVIDIFHYLNGVCGLPMQFLHLIVVIVLSRITSWVKCVIGFKFYDNVCLKS